MISVSWLPSRKSGQTSFVFAFLLGAAVVPGAHAEDLVDGTKPVDLQAVEPSKCERVPDGVASTMGPQLRITPDCLAAHYDFADVDAQTGIVQDKSGNGFDLAAVGQHASVTDGIAGKGVMIDGGYFQAKGNPLEEADHFTVSLWFKTAEPMNNYKLLSAADWSGGNNASGWNIGTQYSEFWADNQEGSLRGDPGWERGVEFRKAEWNHLVVTYDGAFVREFINGQQSAEIHGTGRRVGDGVPMLVGAWMGFRYQGVLDEVRIYRRALKVMEIQALHRQLPQNESVDLDPPQKQQDEAANASLLIAAQNGDLALVRSLVGNGAKVSERNELGETALFGAVLRNSKEVAAFLIQNGADVNARDNNGTTPLNAAGELVGEDNVNTMKALLLKHGAKGDQGTSSLSPDVEVRAKEIAIRELQKWVKVKGNIGDVEQIAGATVSTVKKEGNLIHVVMMKDVSARDEQGRVLPEGMHQAYFHVFLDQDLLVVKVERGPDEIS